MAAMSHANLLTRQVRIDGTSDVEDYSSVPARDVPVEECQDMDLQDPFAEDQAAPRVQDLAVEPAMELSILKPAPPKKEHDRRVPFVPRHFAFQWGRFKRRNLVFEIGHFLGQIDAKPDTLLEIDLVVYQAMRRHRGVFRHRDLVLEIEDFFSQIDAEPETMLDIDLTVYRVPLG